MTSQHFLGNLEKTKKHKQFTQTFCQTHDVSMLRIQYTFCHIPINIIIISY